MSEPPQPNVQYAWYGDDFTGSTDVLEALARYAVPSVLFTGIPSESDRAAFPDCRAVGIAGESRSRPPAWMDTHLPPVLAAMRRLGAPINHYKVCSTFDSSPQTGSIGRAIELGLRAFDSPFVPIIVAAPHLRRSVVYGNLFASANGAMVRIDRHPTMRAHPVTPMDEADLRLHLAKQTSLPVALIDLTALRDGSARHRLDGALASGAKAVLFDGVSYAELDEAAGLLCERAASHPLFAVGSSGLTYGIFRAWSRGEGHTRLATEQPSLPSPHPVDRLLVLSGSCSPVTAAQIQDAEQRGFTTLRLQDGAPWQRQTEQALQCLAAGKSVILYTALGPERSEDAHGAEFSAELGSMLRRILIASNLRRVVIAGGDTSSHVVRQLGLKALTFAAALAPGVPLCRAWTPGSPLDGLEIALKGGQVGADSFFTQARDGR